MRSTPSVSGLSPLYLKDGLPTGAYVVEMEARTLGGFAEGRLGIDDGQPILLGPTWRTFRVLVPNKPPADPAMRRCFTLGYPVPVEVASARVYRYDGDLVEAIAFGRIAELRSAPAVAAELGLFGPIYVYRLTSKDAYRLGSPPASPLVAPAKTTTTTD